MKVGVKTGYWSCGPPGGVDQIAEGERLGFDFIWTAEAALWKETVISTALVAEPTSQLETVMEVHS